MSKDRKNQNVPNELQQVVIAKKSGMKKKLSLIIGVSAVFITGIIVILSITVFSGGNAKNLSNQLDLGNKYLNEMDYERAIVAFNAVLEIDPKNVDAYIGLIDVYGLQENAEKLVEVYIQAAKVLGGDEEGDKAELEKVRAEAKYYLENWINKAIANKNFTLAYEYLDLLIKVDESDAAIIRLKIMEAEKTLTRIGSSIAFGHYEQDNDISDGTEPIEWIVLDEEGDHLLLISRYVLDAERYYLEDYSPYHGWVNSDMRWWLNHDFIEQAFDENEQGRILNNDLINTDTSDFWGLGEENNEKQNSTTDKIFLLSIDEVLQYYGENETQYIAAPTVYARAMYLDRIKSDPSTRDAAREWGYDWSDNSAPWALRSIGNGFPFALVDWKIRSADHVAYRYIGVRPVIWITDTPKELEESEDVGLDNIEDMDLFMEGKINDMLRPYEIVFWGRRFCNSHI